MERVQERTGLEKKFYDLCSNVVSENGLFLYDLEYNPNSKLLRVFIMNKATMTAELDDCVKVDRALTPFIDTLEWMPEELTLEVSSPGLFRAIKCYEHLLMALNEEISLVLTNAMNEVLTKDELKHLKKQKKFVAKLLQAREDAIGIEYKGVVLDIPLAVIKRASLHTDI